MPNKILILPHEREHQTLFKYLKIKQISYEYYEKWDFSNGSRFILPNEECLLILPYLIFHDISDQNNFINELNKSKCSVYFIQDKDVVEFRNHKKLIDKITVPCYLHVEHEKGLHYKDTRIVTTDMPNTTILENLYIDTKQKRDKDFLCITITKSDRPHRQMLVDKLQERNLFKNYLGKINDTMWNERERNAQGYRTFNDKPEYVNFLGTVSGCADYNSWKDMNVYWDLYNRVNYEIVMETYHDFMSYPTEKTYKPIIGKVPFVALGDYKYYEYLHSIGFKTFGNIIDESFAYEKNLNERINKMVDTIQKINPNEFYKKSRNICEHNYKNLCHLHFKRLDEMSKQFDKFFTSILS